MNITPKITLTQNCPTFSNPSNGGTNSSSCGKCAFCDIQTAGIAYLGWQHSDSMIFTLDKYSYENHINLIGMDIYLAPGTADTANDPNYGYDYGQAHDAMDLFAKMKDEGSDNHITGNELSNLLIFSLFITLCLLRISL